jgi:thioesterase domain-containing protein
LELERINQQLGTGYPVPALAVQVTLIRATRQGLIANASAPDLGWSRCCRGPLAIHQVHCTHQDLLLPGHASTVARILHPEPV